MFVFIITGYGCYSCIMHYLTKINSVLVFVLAYSACNIDSMCYRCTYMCSTMIQKFCV